MWEGKGNRGRSVRIPGQRRSSTEQHPRCPALQWSIGRGSVALQRSNRPTSSPDGSPGKHVGMFDMPRPVRILLVDPLSLAFSSDSYSCALVHRFPPPPFLHRHAFASASQRLGGIGVRESMTLSTCPRSHRPLASASTSPRAGFLHPSRAGSLDAISSPLTRLFLAQPGPRRLDQVKTSATSGTRAEA